VDTRLLWLALGGFVGANESFAINGLLPFIASDLGGTVGTAGYLVFAYALVYGIATPILSAAFGHIDRRRLLITAELTVACGILLMALAPGMVLLVAARILLAVGAGLFTATAIAMAITISPAERRGRAIAVVAGGQSAAVLLGVPLANWLAGAYGWRSVYMVLAAMAVAAAAGMWWRLPSGIAGDRVPLRQRFFVVAQPGLPVVYFATLTFMLSAYMPLIFIAPLGQGSGVGLDMLPVALLANGIGAVAGAQAGGRVADRIGAANALRLASLAQIALLGGFAGCVMLPGAVAAPAFVLLIGLSGFVGWSFWPSQSSLIATLSPAAPALAISLSMTALNIGVALAARVGGIVVDNASVIWLGLAGIPFAVAAFVALMVLLPRQPASQPG
jgi:predicted MFS family arabinose efflux permease